MQTKTHIAPILSLKELNSERKRLKNVVLAGGAFDILHEGHLEHLRNAKRTGGKLIVHVVGNKRVREKKGPEKPIFDERVRAQLVASLKCVDYVFIYNGRHYDEKILTILRPDVLFFNSDGFNSEIKGQVAKFKNFNGTIVVENGKKLNNSSALLRTIKSLSEA